MKRISKTAILALLLSAAVISPYAFGDPAANSGSNSTTTGANGPSDTLANGVTTGTTTTGSTPPWVSRANRLVHCPELPPAAGPVRRTAGSASWIAAAACFHAAK